MKIELKPLQASDVNTLYEFFQKLPASENGKVNRAHGLSRQDFAKWVQSEIDSSQGKNLKPEYVPGTTFVMYVDGIPVGVSNLRHYLNDGLKKDGGHIGTHILPEYRGRGYGTIITIETLKKAKEMGIKLALIFNRDDNVPAWHTSEKIGGKLDVVNTVNGVKLRKYIVDTSRF
ncbi:MAG: GNAT family N-acetyltransferase [Alphaproteobacteria bacterium]